jgi:hypothetical protein
MAGVVGDGECVNGAIDVPWREAFEPADDIEVLAAGKVVVKRGLFNKGTDAAKDVRQGVAQRLAEEPHFATDGTKQAEDHANCSGFAGAVGSEEPENTGVGNLERQRLEDHRAPVTARKAFRFNREVAVCHGSLRFRRC